MPSEEHENFVQAALENSADRTLSMALQRQSLEESFEKPTGQFSVEEISIGGMVADWVRTADSRSDVVLLLLHGGGYVVCSKNTHLEYAVRLSRATKASVFVIDYRLAPEHVFPAPVEDAVAAYNWLLSKAFERRNIFLCGDSAGGGLVISTLLALKAEGVELPAAAICLSPWTDLTMSGGSAVPGVIDDPLLNSKDLSQMAALYAQDKLTDPLASPIFGDLTGLPPLLLMVGTREVLLDDARRLNNIASSGGVKVDYYEEEGLVHCWPLLVPSAPESAVAVGRISRFVEENLRA